MLLIGHIVSKSWGTLGDFLATEAIPGTLEEKRRLYGACVRCKYKFLDTDPVHLAQNVTLDRRSLGNRLACRTCALIWHRCKGVI